MNTIATLLLVLGVAAAASNSSTQHACWKRSSTRGVGKPLDACPEGMVQDGLLCYPPCKANYTGVGPVCWEDCPSGWDNTGATCLIPLKIISADNKKCPWYDKCGLVEAKGCSTCPPNEGYHNDGCTCRRPMQSFAKKTYGRTAGKPMVCKPNEEESGALCYPPCPKGTEGIGPVCWASCPADYPVKCGAMCGVPGFSCSDQVVKDLSDILKEVEACESPSTINACLDGIIKLAKDFAMDGLCDA